MRVGVRRTFLLAVTALAIWSLGYGPLLPWSPVHPGFSAIRGNRAAVLYPKSARLPAALQNPDPLLAEAERFHRLRAAGFITIVILPDWPTAYRILPRLARRGIGAITLATGRTIYLLPTITERRLDPVEFVRHEVSHAVLHQNQSLLSAMRIVEVQWLAEGLAVWFGNQRAYISEEDFVRLAPTRDLAAYIDPAVRDRLAEPFDIRFGYVCWRYFNEFLAEPDAERYWRFVRETINQPRAWRDLFQTHFGQSLPQAINAFVQQVRQKSLASPTQSAAPATAPHTLRTR